MKRTNLSVFMRMQKVEAEWKLCVLYGGCYVCKSSPVWPREVYEGVVTHVVQLVAYGDSYVRVRHNVTGCEGVYPKR